MKKKLVLTASTLLAVGLFAALANNKGNTVRVEATEHFDVTIAKVKGASYSYWGNYYVCFADETEDKIFRFQVTSDAEVYDSHHLTPNKIYTLDNMSTVNSYATISDEKFEYVSASLKFYTDENGYVGYEAEAELDNGVSYSLHEADPMSGEMVIDEYKNQYGQITLTDTETGSRFNFVISNIEDGVTYTLSDLISSKYCYIGQRYWNYREATFKRTTDEKGLIHVEATVLTEHGDSLSLKYNEPEPVAVTGVSLNKSSTTIKYGGNETLIATVSPEDADNKKVSWSSSDENVATVDNDGKVTAVSVGSAVITATTEDGEFKATCAVTISESAVSVTNRINALPTPENVTLDDKDAIEAARKAYDSLDADEKALVTTETLKKLTDDEAAYADLEAVNNAVNIINALPEPAAVTINDKNAIQQARAVYDALTADQKAKVSAEVLKKLTDDETALAKEEADTAAANAVITKINALPQPNAVTVNDGEAIEAARAAYDALTEDQKAKVPAEVLKKLTDDETAYAKVVADTEAANKVIEKIDAIGTVELTDTCKAKIDTAKTAYEKLTEAQKELVTNKKVLFDAIELYNTLAHQPEVKDNEVKVRGKDGDLIPVNVNIKVELSTSVKAQEGSVEYAKIQEMLAYNEKISNVFDVKLVRTVAGVETEIQPSDIKEGMIIIVEITLPDGLLVEGLKVLHIHNENDITFVENFTITGNKLTFETDRLSEFAFVTIDPNARQGLPGWAIALIIIGGLLLLCCGCLLVLFIFFPRFYIDHSQKKEVRRAIYIKKHFNEILLLNTHCQFVRRKDVEVFKSKEEAKASIK